MAANGPTDDEGSQIQFVASKTERLTFCWPITDWSERTEPAKTRSYHFMEDNPVSKITWRLELSPCDNVHGCDVVSAALFLNYSGSSQARDYKVMVTLSLRDVQGGQNYTHSSCVYYLTREGPPDGANPSYRVNICTRQELLSQWTRVDHCIVAQRQAMFTRDCALVAVQTFLPQNQDHPCNPLPSV